MIAKSEFKETAIGLMPDDWKANKLKEIAFTTSGGTPSRQKKEFYTGDISWVKSGELNDNYIWDTEEKITKEAIDNSSAKLLNPETLLIAMYGATVGKTAILKIKATTNQAVCSVVPNEKINTDYLRYYFVHIRQHLLNSRYGGAQPNISQTILKDTIVLYPSRNEQDRIAYILLKLQQTIAQQEKIIAKTKELKRSLMQRLFTYGLRSEEQKETGAGIMPINWDVVPLGNICAYTTGKLNSNAAKENGQYPFFTCSQETYRIDNYSFDQEALLLAGNNARAIYSVKYYKGKFDAYQRTYVFTIKDKEKCAYRYLLYELTRKLEMLRISSLGTTTKYITAGIISNLQVALPSLDEQGEIATVLQTIDEKINFETNRKNYLSNLFKTVLQLLMTGQVRVKDIDFGKDYE